MAKFKYFSLDGMLCRILKREDGFTELAEIYVPSEGFVKGPPMEIEFEGIPITKSEFEKRMLALLQHKKN